MELLFTMIYDNEWSKVIVPDGFVVLVLGLHVTNFVSKLALCTLNYSSGTITHSIHDQFIHHT